MSAGTDISSVIECCSAAHGQARGDVATLQGAGGSGGGGGGINSVILVIVETSFLSSGGSSGGGVDGAVEASFLSSALSRHHSCCLRGVVPIIFELGLYLGPPSLCVGLHHLCPGFRPLPVYQPTCNLMHHCYRGSTVPSSIHPPPLSPSFLSLSSFCRLRVVASPLKAKKE
ncbi:hypothetical protein IW261DRAFT_1568477 [Armillaria novae-zelandiae]|uniref:Uncharacterized protein n=1 Tax=Armillaria novae-zelandiae TaxID=153914 RepID=A0AA39NZF1_9AGAR|nr:hypothetical protein IW261DRAFT_1568477 [Armillaria novae-zelandiae]